MWTALFRAWIAVALVQDQQQIQQRQQQAQREAAQSEAEQRRKREDEDRRKRIEEINGPSPFGQSKTIPFVLEPGVCSMLPGDDGFDLQSIPLEAWVAGKNVAAIPWKIQVDKPVLRMDQRQAIAYSATITLKTANGAGPPPEFVFISGVSSMDGRLPLPVLSNPIPSQQRRRSG